MSQAQQTVQRICAEFWWLVLLRGIALLGLGVLLLAWPGVTILVLVKFLGAYFLVDGIFCILNSFIGRKEFPGWGWGILLGVLEILTGVFIFSNPLLSTIVTAGVLVYTVAFLAILFGVLGVIAGIQMRKEVKGEWALIVGGVMAVIFGILLFLNPDASVRVYLMIMGISAVVGGLIQIFASFQLRKFGKQGLEANS